MIAARYATAHNGTRLLLTRQLAISAFYTLSLGFLLMLTAGCGPTERQRIQTVSDQFLEAMSQRDWNRAKPLLTEKARDAMGTTNPWGQKSETVEEKNVPASPAVENYTLGEPKIEEAYAAVPVTLTEADHTTLGTLSLRREDGEWRVRALRIEGENDAPGITLDFENPEAAVVGAAFRALGEGVGEVLKGFGEGMGAFLQGVEKGSAAMQKLEGAHAKEAVGSPKPSPGSNDSVKIEEHTSGS